MFFNFSFDNKKEITIIFLSFVILATVAIISKFYDVYKLKEIHQTTNDIYKHPLQVTNAALNVKLDVIRIHRDMKDVVLILEEEKFNSMILYIDKTEQRIYANLKIIEDNIVGDKGLALLHRTKKLFEKWKPIRDELMAYVINNQKEKAISFSKWESAIHVLKLEELTSKLYDYAQNKATMFKNNSQSIFKSTEKINLIMAILLIFIFLFIAYYIIKRISNYVVMLDESKKYFENILKEAPYPIMVSNEDGEVLLVNKMWEKLSGYAYEEINTIYKWREKAFGIKSKNMVKVMDNFYSVENYVDDKEYFIKTKAENVLVWKFNYSSLGTINKKRSIISSALDITELKEKDKFIVTQSRHAAMGEMISMIAHQWRQPITTISMVANNILLDVDLEELNDQNAKEYSKDIIVQTEHLSKTIDDFRNYFKQDKVFVRIKIDEVVDESLKIIKDSLINNSIEVIYSDLSSSKIKAYKRELVQVFINIINNAKDVLVEKNDNNRIIKINIFDDNGYVYTSICDNGGGIQDSVLPKIFEPYFTTKEESNGTGLGLYMSKLIIEEHLCGKIEASSTHDGVCFVIKLPVDNGEGDVT